MGTFWEAHSTLTPKLTAAMLFLCAAASIAYALLTGDPFAHGLSIWDRPGEIAAEASAVAFLCASFLVFFRPRSGYGLGLVAGLIGLSWFLRTEWPPSSWNSWVMLNSEGWYMTFAKLKILSAALLLVAIGCAFIRLFPARWSLRGSPLCRRTWPAFAVGFLVLAVWFVHSVTPYNTAGYDHGAWAELRVLHVQKRGLRFHETTVTEFRNGRVILIRDGRRLFQYRFEDRVAHISLGDASPTALERAHALVQSPELWKLRTPPARALRSWNAEGWYVVLKDSRLLAFTSEYGTTPPTEVTDLFHEIENLPSLEERPLATRDVCLGFCYDPLAALGFKTLGQRRRVSVAQTSLISPRAEQSGSTPTAGNK